MGMVTVGTGVEMAGCFVRFASRSSIDPLHGAREIELGHEA
jgi:hypothetical protein